eukprot:g29448.t1
MNKKKREEQDGCLNTDKVQHIADTMGIQGAPIDKIMGVYDSTSQQLHKMVEPVGPWAFNLDGETVKVTKLHNLFRCRCTGRGPDGSICSGIDFLFACHTFLFRSTDVKLVFFSNYCLLLADCHLQDDQLYGTKPADSAVSQSFLSSIMEVLDNSMRERLDQPLSLDELTKTLESLGKSKTPGSDGVPTELYSALWDLIGLGLLVAHLSMLLAGSMCESMRK